MKKYMVLPSEYDLNRGDQALVWTSRQIGKDAGMNGDYYMLVDDEKLAQQSIEEGFKFSSPILKHPSRKFKDTENVKYGKALILKWGIVAAFDLLGSLLILSKFTRNFSKLFMSEDEKTTLKLMEETEAFFVKGGGFIHSSGKITDWYTIYYSLYHVALAQSMGKKVYVMPNSFGPFKALGVKKLVRKVLNRCTLVTVRETISKQALEEIEVKNVLSPDLGFYLSKESNDYIDNTISDIKTNYKGYKLVAMTARPYRFPNSDNPERKYEEYINSMVEFSKWLFDNKYLPVFVDHTLAVKEHENDSSAINEITNKLDDSKYAYISNRSMNCRNLKSLYSHMDFVVGTRFHSVIFSLSECVPSLAVTYGGNKGQGIMKDLGLQEFAISMSESNSKDLIEKFKDLSSKESAVKINLQNKKLIFDKEYIKIVNMVKEI